MAVFALFLLILARLAAVLHAEMQQYE